MTERLVRVAPGVFVHLDEVLGEDRGVDGRPSTTDFLVHDLPPLLDLLRSDYEGCTRPLVAGGVVRVLVSVGVLAPAVALYTVQSRDGSITVVGIDIDLAPPGSAGAPR